tara:strand:- start:496 stop:693 length:198 start_codon:yes stop_codon:yes gene_type:complete
MGNSWNKRHEHESPDKIRRDKIRYDKWKADFKKRFPSDEDFRNHIRKKYRWPKYSKYQRAKYGEK